MTETEKNQIIGNLMQASQDTNNAMQSVIRACHILPIKAFDLETKMVHIMDDLETVSQKLVDIKNELSVTNSY